MIKIAICIVYRDAALRQPMRDRFEFQDFHWSKFLHETSVDLDYKKRCNFSVFTLQVDDYFQMPILLTISGKGFMVIMQC